MERSEELTKHLIVCGAIQKGSFVGKSGQPYSIETDIRSGFGTYQRAKETIRLLYDALEERGLTDAPFLGVPETGSLVAFYLNEAYAAKRGEDFSLNMLRASPKEYQTSTNSVYTVLPLQKETEYSLLEDDVVTGKTLLRYLDMALAGGIRIKRVISIFGRSQCRLGATGHIKEGIAYYSLINVDELEEK